MLGTASHQGYHRVFPVPRTCQEPPPLLLPVPRWLMAATLAQPGVAQRACRVPSGHAALSPARPSTTSPPPPTATSSRFSSLWVTNEPQGNYHLLSDTLGRERDIIC